MSTLRGLIRATIITLGLLVLAVFVPLLMWIPLRVRGVKLSAWLVVWMVRFFFVVLGTRVHCDDKDVFRNHHGFIFPNHTSYFDIILMLYILPLRFLSNHKVRKYPLIGWIAVGIETLFVNRKDKDSRQTAREALTEVSHYPAIVLYPEGGITRGAHLGQFRYGPFEIAASGSVPCLPTVIVYDRHDIVAWAKGEHILTAVWRVVTRPGPINTYLYALPAITPTPDDDPRQIARDAEAQMRAFVLEKRAALGVLSKQFPDASELLTMDSSKSKI
ncbi:MAG: 1-acyl-sn-glycerol-3-phosphate acyltransferase [Chloroflexota bacterium]